MITSNTVYNKLEVDNMIQKTKEDLVKIMTETVVVPPSSSAHYIVDPNTMYMDIVGQENDEANN